MEIAFMSKLIIGSVQKIAMQRAYPLVKPLLPWLLEERGGILDFGCGLGYIGCLISEQTKRHLAYVDVRKYPFTCPGLEVTMFDGIKIPYPDKSFDTTLIVSVLHHVPDPIKSLQEILRVSGREIIVCEDLVRSKKEMVTEALKDTITNCFLPHMWMKYKIDSDWEKIFIELGLKIKSKTYFKSKYIFNFNHVAWQLSIQ
jgi:SAM-dependent methyltransferase